MNFFEGITDKALRLIEAKRKNHIISGLALVILAACSLTPQKSSELDHIQLQKQKIFQIDSSFQALKSDGAFLNNPDEFQFALVTDRTGGHREGVFENAVDKINLMQPEFVMSAGDLIEGYTQDSVKIAEQWKEFNGFIKNLQMPFFYVTGNHDVSNYY